MRLTIKPFIQLLLLSSFVLLVACAGKYDDPEISLPAQSVNVSNDPDLLLNQCRNVGIVIGYGASENETLNDIRHQASIKFDANTLVILELESFYQKQRLSNYLRTPILTAPKGTKKYYYIDAFTFKAKGKAYIC